MWLTLCRLDTFRNGVSVESIDSFVYAFTRNSFTLMCSLRPQVRALRSACRHQSIPWLPVTLSASVEAAAFASVIVATPKSFGFAWAVAVVNYPTLRALSMSFVHSLLQLELIHGPKHGCYSLLAHSIDSCRAPVQTAMMSVFLPFQLKSKKRAK